MNQISNQESLRQIIRILFEKNSCEYIIDKYADEDTKYKYEFLQMICGTSNKTKGIFQINNLININPRNCLIQQRIITFIENMRHYSIEQMIMRYDSISSAFYQIKNDERFIDYLKNKKYRLIPFFTMLGFCAYMNLNKDISGEIIEIIKKKYIKKIIEKYTNEMRKSLFNIILYYYRIVLNNNEEESNFDNLLYDELKDLLKRYICFNELFDEGEIANFVKCLYKTITKDAKSIYLKKGPDASVINLIIKYIFEQILENFSFKNYYDKSKMNNLYELISVIINNLSEESLNENYPKFITKYCQYYKQGNKNIVCAFLLGLNPDNFKKTFNCLNFNENDDYYDNIGFYIEQISSKKKKKSKKENSPSKINNLNTQNAQNKNTINLSENTNHISSNSPQTENINNEIINIENGNVINNNRLLEINFSEQTKNEEFMKEFVKMKNQINLLLDKNMKMQDKIDNMSKQNSKILQENKQIKNEFNKFKDKAQYNQIQTKIELFKLKQEIRQISYRDISKPIINNYIIKYKNKLQNENNLKTKKDKAMKISQYLNGKELIYYNKIASKYFDSNYTSHISKIFKDFGMNYIVGLELKKDEIIDKIFDDYCKIILEEKINADDIALIENLFSLKKIIKDLAEQEMVNHYY